jgi:hypothetical protein
MVLHGKLTARNFAPWNYFFGVRNFWLGLKDDNAQAFHADQ